MYKKSLAFLLVIILLVLSVHLLLRSGLFSDRLTRFTASKIRALSGTPVTLDRVTLSLLPTAVVLDGVSFPAAESGRPPDRRPGAPITIEQIRVSVSPWSLLTQVTFIKKIRLIGPQAVLRLGDSPLLPFRLNIDKESAGSPAGPDRKLNVVIRKIEISNGRLAIQQPSGETFLTLAEMEGTVTPDLLMENFQAALSAGRVSVDEKDFHKTFSSLSAQLTLQPQYLEIRKLEITDSVSRYTLTGTVQDPSHPRLALSIDAAFPLADFNPLWSVRFPMSGETRFTGEVVGTWPNPTVRGNLSVQDWTVSSKPAGRMSAVFFYQDRVFSFSELSAAIWDGRVSGNARLFVAEPSAAPGTIPYEFSLQFAELDPSAFLPIFGIESPPSRQKLEGAVEMKGRIEAMGFDPTDPAGQGWLRLTQAEATPDASAMESLPTESENRWIGLLARLQEVSTRFVMDHGSLSLKKTTLRTARSSFTIEGRIHADGPVALDIALESGRIAELAALTPLRSIEGSLGLTGKLTGTWKEPVFNGTGRARDIRLRDRPFEAIESDLAYQNRTLRFKQAVFREKKARYELTGSVAFESSEDGQTIPFFDIAADIRNGSPRDVVAIFTKEMPILVPATGRLTVKGVPKQFRLTTRLAAGEGSVYGQSVDEGTVSLVVTQDQIIFKEARARRGETVMSGKGWIRYKGEFEFSAETTQARLEDFEPAKNHLSALKAPLTGRIGGRGSFRDPEFEAQVSFLDAVFQNQTLGPGTLKVKVKDHRIRADLEMTRGISGAGEIDWTTGRPYRVDLALNDLELKPWLGSIAPNLAAVNRFTASGTVEASGRIAPAVAAGDGAGSGPLQAANATIRLTALKIDLPDYAVTNDGEIHLELRQGHAAIRSLRFKGPGTALSASGDLTLFKSYNFFLSGEADLDLFRIFTNEITYGKGLAYLALQVTDRWEDPKIRGGLIIHDGVVKSASLGQTFTITSVGLSFNERQVLLESLDAKFGGGRLQANGRVDLVRFVPADFGLNLEITDGRLSPLAGLATQFDASLVFQGDPGIQSLTGEVVIHRANYERRLDWQTWVLELLKPEKPESRPPPWMSNTAMNIQIRGKENIWINNNLAKLPLEIDLFLKGSLSRPVLLGRVEAKAGTFTFRRNDFKMRSGTLDFINIEKTRPILDVQADTRVKGYDIEMSLVGPIDKFDLVLSSNPPLKDENEILCLLTFRRPCREVETASREIGTAEASALVTGEIGDIITDKVEALTGIDRIQVDPYYSTSQGGNDPLFTVSQRLLEEKLYVTYATTLDPSKEQIIQMEYEISKNISLIGQRDELGRAGGDLKFHFEFR
ncbi:MAG: translocation/assembly module TamB domain-containing protein [Nitrospirae bacterium]|nr:translocation/assembly module TamB domain-containing protein [Nitrospirota bacterium]